MKVTAYRGTNNRFENFDFGIIGKNTSDLDSVNLGACFTDSNYVDGKIEYICFYPEQIKIDELEGK